MGTPQEPKEVGQHNQVLVYLPDKDLPIIIRESRSMMKNESDREIYNKLLKTAAIGLHKNYKKNSQTCRTNTKNFCVKLAENFDSVTFSKFLKLIMELKKDILEKMEQSEREITPDCFLIFVDKLQDLSHSQKLNQLVLEQILNVDMDQISAKKLMNSYQQHSTDFKFEEKIRMGQIKQFAEGVIPESRFIFDKYKLQEKKESMDVSTDVKDEKSTQPDYFTFFASHEQALLKPELGFKNFHEVMQHLPIDYQILLQIGFQDEVKPNKKFVYLDERHRVPRSNFIMFQNLPVLNMKQTFFGNKNKSKVIKTCMYSDLTRCLTIDEAYDLLIDDYAELELKKQLTKRYGAMRDFEIINFKPKNLATNFAGNREGLSKDHLNEFLSFVDFKQSTIESYGGKQGMEKVNDYILSAQDLQGMDSEQLNNYFSGGSTQRIQFDEKYNNVLEKEEILAKAEIDQKRAATYLREKEEIQFGLNNPVNRVGLIEFKDYQTKLNLMHDPMFMFGLKMHDMPGEVEFFDADLCNSIQICSEMFAGLTLGQCCHNINHKLRKNGFSGELLQVGELKDISNDFQLDQVLVKEDFPKINLRFSNFYQAHEARQALQTLSGPHTSSDFIGEEGEGEEGEKEEEVVENEGQKDSKETPSEFIQTIEVQFTNPEPYYYDRRFATQVESCLKDKFIGLDHINEVPSNYVRKNFEQLKV